MQKNNEKFNPLNRIIAVDSNDANHFLVNGEWMFELPEGFTYEIDSVIGEGGSLSVGIGLGDEEKPMVIRGLRNGSKYLFNFGLQEHFDFTGRGFTVNDCKYDNRAAEASSSFQQIIVVDENDLFADVTLENIWPFGYSLELRVRGTDITPFDFFSMPKNLTNDTISDVLTSMVEIAASICLKDMPISKEERMNKLKNDAGNDESNTATESAPDSSFIIEDGILQNYIGTDNDVVIPKGVTEIDDNTFSGRKIRSVVIPEGVTTIGRRAFENCFELESVSLPSTIQEIGSYCFVDCHKLKCIDLGDNLTAIENSVFSECFELDNVVIPSSVEYIDSFAFKSCEKFTEIVIPDGVKSIGFQSFAYCDNLTYLYVPESVTEFRESLIGTAPFDGSENLTVHTPAGSAAEQYCKSHGIKYVTDDNPADLTAAKANVSQRAIKTTATVRRTTQESAAVSGNVENLIATKVYPFKLAETSCVIEDGVFREYSGKENEIILPDGIREIGDGAFTSSSVSAVVVPEGVTSIGFSAFSDCENLETVVLPNSLESIEDYAFSNCHALKNINIPFGIEIIGSYTFNDCISLKMINLPESVTCIDSFAFSGSGLERIVIPEGVETIGELAFFKCNQLKSAKLPSTLRTIGESAFIACERLTDLYVPSSVCEIGEDGLGFSVSGITIHTPAGSLADIFCRENDLTVVNDM